MYEELKLKKEAENRE
ncbi:Protein of unknown function [Bacillus toyonensis]|nr:Protein of unknown function [Bacillus toyonensis]